MKVKDVVKVLETEEKCVARQEGNQPQCDRNCSQCDLVLPIETVLSAYQTTIEILKKAKCKNCSFLGNYGICDCEDSKCYRAFVNAEGICDKWDLGNGREWYCGNWKKKPV